MNHDVIVIGGSAGCVDVLLDMAGGLPADLPASLFVVIHQPATHAGQLADMLSQRGPLPASHPLHGEKIAPGRIYLAAADTHLLVREGVMEVVRGAKENGHRPAADPLFRSASVAYRSRVVGVVLSGFQDCGTAGMMSIKARGGVSVVQAPETAVAPDMPRSVLARVPVDHVVEPPELAGLLARLATMKAGEETRPDSYIRQLEGEELGTPAELVCPVCQGVLTEAQPGVFEHFRCHVGHAFSLDSLVREQGDEMERALWAAVRSLEEGAALSKRLASSEKGREMRSRFLEKERTQNQQAELIRQILLHGAMLSRADAAKVSAADLEAAEDHPPLPPAPVHAPRPPRAARR
jgi:two-component system chemotaxis response regulator CheB